MVLNGHNENDLSCKISSKILCYSHSNETLVIKKFPLSPHLISVIPMVIHLNEFYEENEMIVIRQA